MHVSADTQGGRERSRATSAPCPVPDRERLIATTDSVQVRVLEFHCRSRSAAPPILFVPGFLSFIESWALVVTELRHQFDVHYLESREKRSSIVRRDSRFRSAELVADFLAVVRALELSEGGFHIVASCGGAATVLEAYPALEVHPCKMVWVAPSLRAVVPWIVVPLSMILRGPLYGVLQRIAIAWYRTFLNPPTRDAFQHSRFMDVVMRADPFKATRSARDLYGLDLDPAGARAIDVPVLVLAASQDQSHRYADSIRLARLVPAAQFEDLGLFWRTHAPAAGRAMTRFLA
jgi:pimeloyl-ACP methyl ester carboxylesterase